MNVFAVDPGPIQSAYVKWDGQQILGFSICDNTYLLRNLENGGDPISVLVIEQIKSYGMSVSDTIFDTVFWTGRFIQAWESAGGTWERVPRMKVKMHLCQNSRAKDGNIRQALIDRFGEPGTKKNPCLTYGLKADLWQAFALAVYYCDCELLIGG